MTCKNCPRYDLQCVWWDVKPCSINHSDRSAILARIVSKSESRRWWSAHPVYDRSQYLPPRWSDAVIRNESAPHYSPGSVDHNLTLVAAVLTGWLPSRPPVNGTVTARHSRDPGVRVIITIIPRNGGPKSMERQLVVVKSTCICASLLERRTYMLSWPLCSGFLLQVSATFLRLWMYW